MGLADARAVIFDLDDTLYPEREYTRSGARAVGTFLKEAYGDERGTGELLALEEQEPLGRLYSRWLRLRGLDEDLWLPRLLNVHRTHRPSLALDPGVYDLLRRLRRTKRLGLVSDGRMAQQQAKTEALGLTDLLDALVFSDALGRDKWKPHPAPFHLVLELLQVPAQNAVYVADNPAKDFLGARRAGIRSIRVRRPDGLHFSAEAETADFLPDEEIDDVAHLERLFS